MTTAVQPKFAPLPDRTLVLDLVRPGLFRKDADNITVMDSAETSYASLNDALSAARQIAKPGYADLAVVKSGESFGLQHLMQSFGPGMGGAFDKAYGLKLQDRDWFRYVHPDLQAVVGAKQVTTREQLLARLR